MPILSLVSLPRGYSIFIPAFSMVEFYSARLNLTKKEAVLKFWNEVRKMDLTQLKIKVGETEVYLNAEEIERVKQIPVLKRDFKSDMDLFYDIPNSFSDWNFANMAYQYEKALGKYQIIIFEAAKKFCRATSTFDKSYSRHPLYFKEYLK